ncbi:MAG: hypothetical protein ACXAAH_10370 [Promethearchaeota archaeon]|jgi:hypothetical protein
MRNKKGKRYNWKNWKVGDRVRANPDFEWSYGTHRDWNRKGTVTKVTETTLSVTWDDKMSTYYSYACSSLINVNKSKLEISLLPDSLFEI